MNRRYDSGVVPGSNCQVDAPNPGVTAQVAEVVARQLSPSDVLILGGDLGAGKTTFTKALGASLGVAEAITSPTFALAHVYQAHGFEMHHLDVYRLEPSEVVLDLDLPGLLDAGGVVVIEWGDTIVRALPPSYLALTFSFGAGSDDRHIEIGSTGREWAVRVVHIVEELEQSGLITTC